VAYDTPEAAALAVAAWRLRRPSPPERQGMMGLGGRNRQQIAGRSQPLPLRTSELIPQLLMKVSDRFRTQFAGEQSIGLEVALV